MTDYAFRSTIGAPPTAPEPSKSRSIGVEKMKLSEPKIPLRIQAITAHEDCIVLYRDLHKAARHVPDAQLGIVGVP